MPLHFVFLSEFSDIKWLARLEPIRKKWTTFCISVNKKPTMAMVPAVNFFIVCKKKVSTIVFLLQNIEFPFFKFYFLYLVCIRASHHRARETQ